MTASVIGRKSRLFFFILNSSNSFLKTSSRDDQWFMFQGTYVEGMKEEVVLSPGHALSFIAAGEG